MGCLYLNALWGAPLRWLRESESLYLLLRCRRLFLSAATNNIAGAVVWYCGALAVAFLCFHAVILFRCRSTSGRRKNKQKDKKEKKKKYQKKRQKKEKTKKKYETSLTRNKK